MKPDFSKLTNVYIQPGEACFTVNPIVVSTVLGSCLSITMFHKAKKLAGISHCQLPNNRNCDSACHTCSDPWKYVNCTIVHMIKKFDDLKINRKEIEVKLFGGADVLKTSHGEKKISTVGRQNIQMAHEILSQHNMIISATDVGGRFGRKIFFLTETGEIFLNRLKNDG